MAFTLDLLGKLKYPALTLPTTGIGFGICSLCHDGEEKELKQIQQKNKEIEEWKERHTSSEKRRAKERIYS